MLGHDPRLRAPGDVPKRTSDAAPPWPVAPVSTVAPASTVAPVSTVAMAAPIVPMASILLPQSPRDDRCRRCGARDARTQANGGESQCADHRSSSRNFLEVHSHASFPNPLRVCNVSQPKFMPAVGDLVQTTTRPWITHPPTHCTNGRRLGPGELLVGHQACLGDSGGHTSCTWRTPGSTIYSNSWWEHHHRLNRPPAGIPTRPVSATRNGGAIGTDRLGMARSQRRRSQAKFRTDGVS